jgi:predicted RNA-binding protein associated with RNAse of E/G family
MSKPVKIIHYDLAARTSTVKAGCYPVDMYESGDAWLYMARKTVSHPYIAYMKVFLIPSLGLQINKWQFHKVDIPDEYSFYDYYIDVGKFEQAEDVWLFHDFYLDVLVVEGKGAHVLDTDEYLEALSEKLINSEDATFSLETTHSLVNGLAENGYNLEAWLKQKGIDVDLGKLK